jgi:hypothetical protein
MEMSTIYILLAGLVILTIAVKIIFVVKACHDKKALEIIKERGEINRDFLASCLPPAESDVCTQQGLSEEEAEWYRRNGADMARTVGGGY